MTTAPKEPKTVSVYTPQMEAEQKLRNMTKAQQRAISWLPTNGSRRCRPKNHGYALRFLEVCYPQLVKSNFDEYGPRGTVIKGWWLTREGIEFKKKIENLLPSDESLR